MQNRTTVILATAVIGTSLILAGQAQEPAPKKPAGLAVLDRYVGTWLHEATLLPSKSTPKKTTRRAIEQTEWTLGDSFLMNRAVNETDGLKSLSFFTVNRSDQTTYPFWYFSSSGGIGLLKGKWDEASRTMTFSSPNLPPGWKGSVTHKFSDDSYNSSMIFTNDAGETVMDRHDLRKRQAGIAGKRMLETWAKIGTPIEPIPDQMKKLQPFIGEWDSEFIQRPSVVSPKGGTSKGSMTGQWILDGRFLFGTFEVGNHKSKWVIGYDTNKKAYRYIRFTNKGLIDESTGQWSEKTRSFVWKLENAPAGVTRTSTNRIVGNNEIHAHILAKKNDGKVQMDLTIKTTRRK